jgi:anti-sigma factor RsiW
VAFLADYLSGELAVAPRRAFDSHHAECSSCANYTRTYLAAIRIASRALGCGSEPAPTDVPEELVQSILSAREESA